MITKFYIIKILIGNHRLQVEHIETPHYRQFYCEVIHPAYINLFTLFLTDDRDLSFYDSI